MAYSLNHGILYLEEIYTAIVSCENIRDSAMVLLMLSSNMNSDLLSVLTVGDFLEACRDYIGGENDINSLLESDPWSIIPCWRDVANQKVLLFNTPEATFYILLYLNRRKFEGEELTVGSPLFLGKNNFAIKPKSIRNIFSRNKFNSFHVDFTQTSLLNTFKFVCGSYCENEDFVRLLLMEDVEENLLYSQSNETLRNYYRPLIPFLTAKSFNCGSGSEVNTKIDVDILVDNYYTNYINHRNIKYDFIDELKIKNRARKVKNSLYDDCDVLNNTQLDIIYKYAECECLMLKKPYLAECEHNKNRIIYDTPVGEDDNREWIFNCFKEMGIIGVLEISEERIKKEIIRQSVNKNVNLNLLTYCGLLEIFDGLLEAVLI